MKVQSVTEALASISKTIELAGQPSPLYKAPNEYILPLERLVEGFRREDPPPIPQLAVPISVSWGCHRVATESQEISLLASSQLIIIAFFYLLRVGKYTHPRYVKQNSILKQASNQNKTILSGRYWILQKR